MVDQVRRRVHFILSIFKFDKDKRTKYDEIKVIGRQKENTTTPVYFPAVSVNGDNVLSLVFLFILNKNDG